MKDRTNRNLLLGVLLGVALCAVVWLVDIAMVLFALTVPFFCAQLLLLRLTRKWPVRLLPVYPILLLLGAAGYYLLFGKGWDALAALILALIAAGPAVGCLLAALVFRFAGRVGRQGLLVAALVLLGWGGAWLGQEIALGYWDRAFIKALSFLGCVGMYALLTPPRRSRETLPLPLGESPARFHPLSHRLRRRQLPPEGGARFPSQPPSATAPPKGEPSILFQRPDRTSLKTAAALSLAVFLFLTVGYMVLAPWIDLSAIPEKLRDSGVTAENFPLVAAYITLGNSFLEEFFFRGFAFLTLRKHTGEKFAYLFSGVTFAAYHVSIMSGWFHPVWFVVFLAGLAVGGMLFDALDRKGGLWCGWLVHASADLAIMLIGMRMFGIL